MDRRRWGRMAGGGKTGGKGVGEGGGVRDAQFGNHIFPPHVPFIPPAISKRVTGIQNTTFTKPERWTRFKNKRWVLSICPRPSECYSCRSSWLKIKTVKIWTEWGKYLSPPNIALAHPGDWSLLPADVEQHGERVVLIETDYRPTTAGSVTVFSYLVELAID